MMDYVGIGEPSLQYRQRNFLEKSVAYSCTKYLVPEADVSCGLVEEMLGFPLWV